MELVWHPGNFYYLDKYALTNHMLNCYYINIVYQTSSKMIKYF